VEEPLGGVTKGEVCPWRASAAGAAWRQRGDAREGADALLESQLLLPVLWVQELRLLVRLSEENGWAGCGVGHGQQTAAAG